jgi:PP-loop superfamily ATP-utilizing enzyme
MAPERCTCDISHTLSATNSSAIACAIPTPSVGEVPRPNSSMSTKELGVAKPVTMSKHLSEQYENNMTKNHSARCHLTRECAQAFFQVIIVRQSSQKVIVDPVKVENKQTACSAISNIGNEVLPKAGILGGDKRPAHRHDSEQSDLSQIRTLAYHTPSAPQTNFKPPQVT